MKVIEIENYRTRLLEYVQGVASERSKFFQIVFFLSILRSSIDNNSAVSYELEFASFFFQYFDDASLKHSNPEFYKQIDQILQIYERIELHPDLKAKLGHYRQILMKQTVYEWLNLGEWEKAINGLQKHLPVSHAVSTSRIETYQPTGSKDIFESFADWAESIRIVQPEIYPLCLDVINWHHSEDRDFLADTTQLLFADQTAESYKSDVPFGMILPVQLHVKKRPKDAEEDIVKFNNEILSSRSHINHVFHDVILAVRSVAEKRISEKLEHWHFTFHLSIPQKEAVFTGSSWDAPIALLIYCGILNQYYRQKLARVSQDTLITGCLDMKGHILPVSNASLKSKVSATFFSSQTHLIVPMQQIGEAAEIINNLRNIYPNRHLTLEGAENLDQLISDKNAFKQDPMTFRRRLVFWMKQLREKPAAILSFALVLIVLFVWIGRWITFDRNPVSYEIRGSHFVAKNLGDQDLWSYDFKDPVNIQVFPGMDGTRINLRFADLNGDRQNEVLYGPILGQPDWQGLCFCFSNRGKLLWKHKIGRPIEFGNENYEDHYNIFGIYTDNLRGDGNVSVLIEAGHAPYFPSVLTVLDNQGELMGEYWNSGRMNVCRFADLNRDGIRDILSGGINNETRGACLVVLNPFNMKGCSPQDSSSHYYSHELETGSELYYLRFPGSAFRYGKWGEAVIRLSILENELSIAVGSDYMVDTPNISNTFDIVEYRLDYQLHLISFSPTDPYFSQHEKHFGRFPSESEIAKLGQIQYWNGKEWVFEPTMVNH
ncbi:hypothetical protein EH221_01360 [bacterium]|nr:MAG: hypothetical protein EH221_01360 [bacterium]